MLTCGVLGFFMRRYGLSPAALVIALVLGPLGEETLRQTLLISDGSWSIFVERGTSIVLLLAMVVIVLIPLLTPFIRRAVRARLDAIGERRAGRRADARSGDGDEPPAQEQDSTQHRAGV
jgi:putative tricarboxylic transport membrane protein